MTNRFTAKIFHTQTPDGGLASEFMTNATAISIPILSEQAEALKAQEAQKAAQEKEDRERGEMVYAMLEEGGLNAILAAMQALPDDKQGMSFRVRGPGLSEIFYGDDIGYYITLDIRYAKCWKQRSRSASLDPGKAINITIAGDGVYVRRGDKLVEAQSRDTAACEEMRGDYEEASRRIEETLQRFSDKECLRRDLAPLRQMETGPGRSCYATLKEAVNIELAGFIATIVPERVEELNKKIIEIQNPKAAPIMPKLKGVRAFLSRFKSR